MCRIISILRTLCLVTSLISIGVALDNGMPRRRGDAHFCYEEEKCGPASPLWDEKCKIGQRQSPINLPLMSDASAKAVTLDFNDKYNSNGIVILKQLRLLHQFFFRVFDTQQWSHHSN